MQRALAKAALRRDREREAAARGERPDGKAVEWYDRIVPDDEFSRYQSTLKVTGLLCDVSLFISGSNANPSQPLLGLKIDPKEAFFATKPPHTGTPWHISVGFCSDFGPSSAEEVAFVQEFSRPREVRLLIRKVIWNGITYLRSDDPIASHPIVKAFHASSFYRNRPLHITF